MTLDDGELVGVVRCERVGDAVVDGVALRVAIWLGETNCDGDTVDVRLCDADIVRERDRDRVCVRVKLGVRVLLGVREGVDEPVPVDDRVRA